MDNLLQENLYAVLLEDGFFLGLDSPNATVSVSGLELTSSFGSVSATGIENVTVEITGQEITSSYGMVSSRGDGFVSIFGEEVTSSAGVVTSNGIRNVTASTSGLQATSARGLVTASAQNPQVIKKGRKKSAQFIPFVYAPIQYLPEPKHATAKVYAMPMLPKIGSVMANGTVSINATGRVQSQDLQMYYSKVLASGIINPSDEEIIFLLAA